MARVTAHAIKELARRTEDMASLQKNRGWKRVAFRTMLMVLAVAFLYPFNPFKGISLAEEKDTVLSGSGIVYPGGYDLDTVGDIQGSISRVVIPESGPVSITLKTDRETYIVLASPGWFWKELDADLTEGTEVTVRGSKTPGLDGKLYIIAQEIRITKSKKTLAFRSESGQALWGTGSQTGKTSSRTGGFGSSSGGFGSSSSGRTGGNSSGRGRGGR